MCVCVCVYLCQCVYAYMYRGGCVCCVYQYPYGYTYKYKLCVVGGWVGGKTSMSLCDHNRNALLMMNKVVKDILERERR